MIRYVRSFPDPKTHRFDRREWLESHGADNVVIHCDSGPIDFPTHWGPLSLKSTFRGREYYVRGGGVVCVEPDRFLILNEDTRYSSYIPHGERTESFTINFGSAFLDRFHAEPSDDLDGTGRRKTHSSNRVAFYEHAQPMSPDVRQRIRAVSELLKNVTGHRDRLDEELTFLYEELLVLRDRTRRLIDELPARRRSTRAELFRRLHAAIDYIHACYAEAVTLDVLSRVSCLSRFHLLRQFKGYFGVTPHQYLTQRRLEEAERLLRLTDRTVTDICKAVGFEDKSSFISLFRRIYGRTPGDLRKP